jgi:L-rhamnonate dehydratase
VAECLEGLRAAAPDARLMVDGLGGARVDQALALLPVLEDVEVTWAEELLPPGSPGWARLSDARGRVPLAAGEHAYDEAEQVRLQNSGQIDVWQVDVGWCGGMSRALHTVEVAAEQGIPTFPHGDSLTSALTLAAVCCRDKIPAIEYHLTLEPIRQSTARTPTVATSGKLAVAQGPGLHSGFRLDSSESAILLADGGEA